MGSAWSMHSSPPQSKSEILATLVGFGLSLGTAYFVLNQLLKRLDPTDAEKRKSQEIVSISSDSVSITVCTNMCLRPFSINLLTDMGKTNINLMVYTSLLNLSVYKDRTYFNFQGV